MTFMLCHEQRQAAGFEASFDQAGKDQLIRRDISGALTGNFTARHGTGLARRLVVHIRNDSMPEEGGEGFDSSGVRNTRSGGGAHFGLWTSGSAHEGI